MRSVSQRSRALKSRVAVGKNPGIGQTFVACDIERVDFADGRGSGGSVVLIDGVAVCVAKANRGLGEHAVEMVASAMALAVAFLLHPVNGCCSTRSQACW